MGGCVFLSDSKMRFTRADSTFFGSLDPHQTNMSSTHYHPSSPRPFPLIWYQLPSLENQMSAWL